MRAFQRFDIEKIGPTWFLGLQVCLSLALIVTCFIAFRIHLDLVLYPYPLHHNEASEFFTAKLISEGVNPYTLEQVPLAAQVYGILQAVLVSPLVGMHGQADLFILRFFNGLCLLGSAGIIYD